MKKKTIIITVLVVMAALSAARANGLGAYGSFWQAKDADNAAFGVGAKMRLSILPIASLEGRVNYFPDFKYSEYLDVNVKNAEIAATLDLPVGIMKIYAGGGGGYYWFEGTGKDGASDPNIDNKFGIFALAGITVNIFPGFALFGEGRYTWVDADIQSTWEHAKEQDEGKLDGPGVNLGLMLTW
jgi:hypothetical protein